MLHIICATEDEANHLNIKGAKIHKIGIGLYHVLKSPRLELKEDDIVLNIGYAGSNVYKPGEVLSVNLSERYNRSSFVYEEVQIINPLCFKGVDCFTADDFIESANKKLPLVDMELYYLCLIYPEIRAIKIVSDNLDLKGYKKADFKDSWDLVNKAVNEWIR